MRALTWTVPALVGTAALGGLGTDVRSSWYARLDKPAWQPPGWAFGPAWTTLYTLIAVGSARTIDRIEDDDERQAYIAALATNLVLNIGWTWVFFTAKKPRWALAEIAALNISNLDLVRRSGKVDAAAGWLLAPYAAWTAFATALNASIAARNPSAG
ncbi:MAG: tryptophan-rich sensory protein [Actinomycetota bacterium]|nr:tryptophan-rich sensory protein [Actinomycetota bacterium]